MKDLKHTKGEWTITKSIGGQLWIYSDEELIELIALISSDNEADAKLIAAAPDLLEACMSIYADLEIAGKTGDLRTLQLEKAIKKATS